MERILVMLQAFLLQMIPAMEQGIMLLVPLGILLAIILPMKDQSYKETCKSALKWGFYLSIFFVAVKTGTRQAVSRELFEAMAIAIALVGEITLMVKLLLSGEDWEEKQGKSFKLAIAGVAFALFLYHGMEIWLIPVTIVMTTEGSLVTLAVLIKMLGFLVGMSLGFLSGYLVYKAASALTHKRLTFVFTVQIIATVFQQLIFFIQVLMARQLISGAALMKVMAPLIDHQSWVIFVIFFVTFLVPVTLFLQPRPERPEGFNPAQYRKLLASAKHKKRWGAGVVAALIITVTASSAGSWYANLAEELVPAVPVKAENGFVNMPLSEVGDGHLHRYGFRAQDGTMVRVIIIQKGGSAYGVGLDACEICGPTGYYEKDNQVICKLCGVMMNKATIGMPGGCNPIPVEYKVEDGAVRIAAEVLDKAGKYFH